jgi:hypothetical protein
MQGETMKLLPAILLYSSLLGATTTTTIPPKSFAPKTTTATNLTPLEQVQKYADGRHITITKLGGSFWHHRKGWYFVEIDNVDAHGVGETKQQAIQDFLYRADLLDHETNKPHLSSIPADPGPPAGFVCPQDQNCL